MVQKRLSGAEGVGDRGSVGRVGSKTGAAYTDQARQRAHMRRISDRRPGNTPAHFAWSAPYPGKRPRRTREIAPREAEPRKAAGFLGNAYFSRQPDRPQRQPHMNRIATIFVIALTLGACTEQQPQKPRRDTKQSTDQISVTPSRVERLQRRAEQGDAEAQYTLGEMYYDGSVVSQNYAEAAKWTRKAAEQGHAEAQYFLGDMYYLGEGVAQSDTKSAEWTRKAAEQGHAEAQLSLGEMYAAGLGVPQNDTKAEEWTRKAAEQGHAGAQWLLEAAY